jgi:hypothetical protein
MSLARISVDDAVLDEPKSTVIGTRHIKHYGLNIEKSLMKKLNSAKRKHISYRFTGGGLTAELGAITFELFIHACEIYFVNSSNNFCSVIKDNFTDRHGSVTQRTYEIKESDQDSYPINLYTTRCSMLVNGKRAANFINRDLNNLHEIIKSTTINGVSVNIQNTNDLLAKQLEDVIHSMNIGTNGMQATVNDEMNDLTEKCFKCKRSCRSRAVLCINKHWVHFNCEKFTELEIEQIEQNENEPYTCSQC